MLRQLFAVAFFAFLAFVNGHNNTCVSHCTNGDATMDIATGTGTVEDIPSNNCVTFSVSQGTGCAWMCSYCANQLGTNNYYFTDNVCSYQEGVGCVGNPTAGASYTCCSV